MNIRWIKMNKNEWIMTFIFLSGRSFAAEINPCMMADFEAARVLWLGRFPLRKIPQPLDVNTINQLYLTVQQSIMNSIDLVQSNDFFEDVPMAIPSRRQLFDRLIVSRLGHCRSAALIFDLHWERIVCSLLVRPTQNSTFSRLVVRSLVPSPMLTFSQF